MTNRAKIESGGFNDTTGDKESQVNRLRTKYKLLVKTIYSIKVPDGFQAYLFFYDKKETYLGQYGWRTGIIILSIVNPYSNADYINILFRKIDADSSDISEYINTVESSLLIINNQNITGHLATDTDLNDVKFNSIYALQSDRVYTHKPSEIESGWLLTYEFQTDIYTQFCASLNVNRIYSRQCLFNNWSEWIKIAQDQKYVIKTNGALPNNTDFDNIKENCIYGLNSLYTYGNDPLPSSGFLECVSFDHGNIFVQTARDLLNETSYTRWYFNGWKEWIADDYHDMRKVYYAFGDSTTYGQIGGVGGQSKYNYPAVASKLMKMKLKNKAVSNQGLIKDWDTIHTNYISGLGMTDANLITIGWAYNDSAYYSDIAFGSYTDISDVTFIGKYFTIMKEFQQKCPKAKLILITGYGYPDGTINPTTKPTLIDQFTHEYTFNDGQKSIKEIYDTLEDMCHLHGWSCINQSKGTVFNQWNASELIGDQIHPSDDGYLVYGNYLGAKIASIYGNIMDW